MHVKDKVCVVTGAAGGIGAAVARAYAEAGARGVVVSDLRSSRAQLAEVAGDIDGLAVTADVGCGDKLALRHRLERECRAGCQRAAEQQRAQSAAQAARVAALFNPVATGAMISQGSR